MSNRNRAEGRGEGQREECQNEGDPKKKGKNWNKQTKTRLFGDVFIIINYILKLTFTQ